MKRLILGIAFFLLPSLAVAIPTPKLLSVFVCQTVRGHFVEDMARKGVAVMPAPNWQDLDWAFSNKYGVPTKICERRYVSIQDKTAPYLAANPKPVTVDPDASDPTECAWLAMQIVGTLKDPGIIVGCPRPVYNGGKIVAYTDPPCPPNCDCVNEPSDI